ncbi:MAG: CcoQ/FixQ family Cbb3-type cytochrome c oxidase assembly chaperone [Burkholderiaceae bacterium]
MKWLILSVLALLVVVAWVYRKGSKSRYEKDAQIPFEDGDHRGGA